MYTLSYTQPKPSYLSTTAMLYKLNIACENLQKYIYGNKFTHIQQTEMGTGGNKSNK